MTATAALLDRARRHVTFAELCRFVGPSDPGWIESLGLLSAIRDEGAEALLQYVDYEPLHDAVRVRRTATSNSSPWYRIMAAAAALLSDDDMLAMSAHCSLARAIADTRALGDAGHSEAPTDLIAEVCRELGGRKDTDPEAPLFATLGELVTADLDGGRPDIATLCGALKRIEQELAVNGSYSSPEYLWGATNFDSHHGLWLSLVRDHFPTHTPDALEIRASLLEHGTRWAGTADVASSPDEEGASASKPYSLEAIAFFAHRAKSSRGRAVALRLADECFDARGEPAGTDDDFGSRLSALNNAINTAHASGAFELAARWADMARPFARDNEYLPHNLACAFQAVGRNDDAFAMCALAVELDIPGLEQIRDDEDLGSLRREPRFVALFGKRAGRRSVPNKGR